MRTVKIAALVLPLAILISCAPVDSTPKPLTDKQAKLLNKELVGKIAGKPTSCINDYNAANIIRISDDMLLYRVSGNLVYQNKLRGTCSGLANDSDIMVTEKFSSQSCRGDIIRMVDRTSGIQGGFCSLGDFVPYRKDKRAG